MDVLKAVFLILVFLGICEGNSFVNPPTTFFGCVSRHVNLSWTFLDQNDVSAIVLSKTAPTSAILINVDSGVETVGDNYIGRIEYISGGTLTLKNPVLTDTGTYKCSVVYNSFPNIDDVATLTIYDFVNTALTCEYQKKTKTISCNSPHSSIILTTTTKENVQVNAREGVLDSESYTICMTGGASICLSSDVSPCITIQGNCSETFHQNNRYFQIMTMFILVVYVLIGT